MQSQEPRLNISHLHREINVDKSVGASRRSLNEGVFRTVQIENKIIDVYIEIEKHSNIKYEFDKTVDQLLLDRILPYPYFYPYAYGFIPNTLAEDGDELDALIITDRTNLSIDTYYKAYVVGVLLMEDEKGMDEKILVVPVHEYDTYNKIEIDNIINSEKLENIFWFFSNYKNKTKDKWSKVYDYIEKENAVNLYKECKEKYMKSNV